MPRLREFTSLTFQEAVSSTAAPLLVHFGTDWCAPCKKLERLLLELAPEWGDSVALGKVNVEDEPDLARTYSVTRNPSLCLFRSGVLVARHEGLTGKPELLELVHQPETPLAG